MTNSTINELKQQVFSIITMIENGFDKDEFNNEDEPMTAYDYIHNALDCEYIVGADRQYKGARLLVAFGGPNIWIDIRNREVEGSWGGESFIGSYEKDALGLDESLEELYNCGG